MSASAKELERVVRNVNPGGWAVERDHPIATLLGPWSRKIVFDPASGDAYGRRIANTMATAAEVARKGDTELF